MSQSGLWVKKKALCSCGLAVFVMLLFAYGQMGNAHTKEDLTRRLQRLQENNRTAGTTPLVKANAVTAQADPAEAGRWEGPFDWPLVAIHMILLPTGEVLMWDGPPEDGGGSARLWNPATGAFTSVPNDLTDLFCVGHAALADGRVLTLGGHVAAGVGVPDVNIFDPVTRSWSSAAPMAFPRWYPTATTLPDGRVLVTSGSDTCETCFVSTPEIYDPQNDTWTQLTTANLALPLYPFMFVLPDGQMLNAGGSVISSTRTRVLNIAAQTWTQVGQTVVDGHSAVMYTPGKVMKSGAAADVGASSALASAATHVLDMTQASPAWRTTAPMAFPRAFHTLTLLPDGSVLATGGGQTRDGINYANGVLEAELWSPVTETWTTMAPMQVPRLYHSTALLLPDGRVLVAGSGRFGPAPQFSAEIYSPPYLFKGPRPTISSVPGTIRYNGSFFVETPDASDVSAISFVRMGSVTHAFHADQRFLNLTFQPGSGGLNVQAPVNANLAPPGYYMLFLVNSAGVPSSAATILLGEDADDDGLPDSWELRVFGTFAHGSTEDFDGDGLTNAEELAAGTDPTTVDTDGDGFSDSTEVSAGSDPRDPLSMPTSPLQVTPTNLSFSSTVNGPPPSSQTLTITDINGNTVSWTASVDQPWLTISSISGTTPSAITVNVSTAGLAIGSYTGAITITPSGAGNVSQTVSVTLVVLPLQSVGLVAAYDFNAGSGATVADVSGHGHTGTLSGATWTPQGRFGAALSFDGANDWVTIADAAALDLTTGMTLSAWVYPTATTGWRTVLLKEQVGGLIYALYASTDSTQPSGHVFVNGQEELLRGPVPLPPDTWTYLATTYDGTTLRLYVNGTEVASRAVAGPILSSTGVLRIGGNNVWSEWFQGRIDEVRLYNRALTASELQADMLTPVAAPPAGAPVAAFSATPTAGLAPLTVAFSDASTGSLTAWSWDFGDGSTSTAQHPSHTYAVAGTYTVSLTVSGPNGADSAVKTDYITVTASASSLVAAYDFNAGSGATVADVSGHGHTGTLSGATWTPQGRFGAALSFDGANDWVTIADAAALDLTTGMTLSAWVYPTATTGWRTVLLKEQVGGLIYALYASTDSTQPSGHVFVNGQEELLRGPVPLPPDTWTYLATTYDGTTLRLYVNGTEVASRAVAGPILSSTGVLRIGGNNVWSEWFQGRIDEVRLYNRALTASELQADMLTPVP